MKELNRKPNKTWVNKGSTFCSRSMRSGAQDNNMDSYSTYNEGKSASPEIFIRAR